MTLGGIMAKEALRQQLLTELIAQLVIRVQGQGYQAAIAIDKARKEAHVTLYRDEVEIKDHADYDTLGVWWESRNVVCKHGKGINGEDFHIFRVV